MTESNNLVNESMEKLDLIDAERLKKQGELRKLRGKFHWEGDLEEMRADSQQLQDWYDSQYNRGTN